MKMRGTLAGEVVQRLVMTLFVVVVLQPSFIHANRTSVDAIRGRSYNILMFMMPAMTHALHMASIATELADRGHNVTVLAVKHMSMQSLQLDRPDISVERYELDPRSESYEEMMEDMMLASLERKKSFFQLLLRLKQITDDNCYYLTMKNEELLRRLEKERFDMAVVDSVYLMRCMHLIPHRLHVPVITFADAVPDVSKIRTPWLPSFVPHVNVPFTDRMTFGQRLVNFLVWFIWPETWMFPDPPQNVIDMYRKYGEFRDLDDLISRSLLWLITKDVVLDYPRPQMPNMINIGGLAVKRSHGQLPKEYADFIAGATNGVIVVSFGSVFARLPNETVVKFVSAFERLDGIRVVWRLKVEGVSLPDNVLTAPWLPQNDLLAHPSVRLFITHCGNKGQFQAIYNAVPMLGFPLFGDHFHDAGRLVQMGYGMSMNLFDFTADELFDAIQKVMTDPSYMQRITNASEIFRSQSESPVQRAAFWIEHVCRFGANHLRSAGNDLPFYAYWMLDVLAVLAGVVALLIYFCFRVICFCLLKFGPVGKTGLWKLKTN